VVAVVDGKEIVAPGASAADIKFKVLSNQSVQQLNQLQKSKSHLALGVFYASEGLIAEAQREFQILQRDNKSSQTARKLLDKIQGWQKE
jgi:formate dehydrogenase assembly factor FdhD